MVPVSSAFEIPLDHPLRAEIEGALAAIDSVHGDGVLPRIPFTSETRDETEGRLGRYSALKDGRRSKSKKIMLCAELCHEEQITHLAIVHEVGHFLAHMAIGEAGQFWSEVSELALPGNVRAWKRAAQGTDAWDDYKKCCFTLNTPDSDPEVIEKLRYRGNLDEVWARAYSQFIAVRSQHRALLRELERARSKNAAAYWEARDFKKVGQAIESLLREQLWL